ncbi:MAG: hypothetical protein PVG33_13945, partial [Chloroflexota bacterium]
RASYVLAGESVTGQAQMIGMAEAVAGDYHWYENTLEALASVTLDDIERVRQTYLRPGNRVVGLYQPEQNGQE